MRGRRRQRRSSDGAGVSSDRWVVSYADFITLLFAFFVVMYAISTVSDVRYNAVSHSLSAAFAINPTLAKPGTGGSLIGNSPSSLVAPDAAFAERRALAERRTQQLALKQLAAEQKREQHMVQVADRLTKVVAPLVADGTVTVTKTSRGVAVEINASVLFDAGAADLRPASILTLEHLAQVLGSLNESIEIEGHADDQPIASARYPTNWELSSARADRVARYFVTQGIDPARLGAVGYAEFRPLTTDKDPASRARNRRVTLMILTPLETGSVGETQ